MSFYFRKSMKFGPFRTTLSKSGASISFGVKCARIGAGPRGNFISINKFGVSYRSTINKKIKENKEEVIKRPEVTYQDNLVYNEIESADISQITDSKYEDILADINLKYKRMKFTPIYVIVSLVLLFIKPEFILLFILLPIFLLIDYKRKTIYLLYQIESEQEEEIQAFFNSFSEVMRSKMKWHISSEAKVRSTNDYKMNAGAMLL